MITRQEMEKKLERVFDKTQAIVLTEIITDAYDELVKARDFNELKAIVKELAEAQKKSEERLTRLEITVNELAEAQKRTELRMEELAEAQKRTELQVAELAEDIRTLTRGLDDTRKEVGGLSRSVSYALENEAYRRIPKVLKGNYGIDLKERLIRTEIGGKEVNIFGRAKKDGKVVLIIGEVKLRLDDRKTRGEKDVVEELEEKVKAVKTEYGEEEIIRVLITHYATKGFIREAKDRGIIVIQSFEW